MLVERSIEADAVGRFQPREERADRDAETRVYEVGRDFRERHEDERALVQARVRNGQCGRKFDEPIVHEDVDIDGARSEANTFGAPHFVFDFLGAAQEIDRRERRRPRADEIEEPRLLAHAPRFRFVNRRDARDLNERANLRERGTQILFAVAQVRAEREIDGGHATHCIMRWA